MSEESNNGLEATKRGMSRRTALKAGAAVGVGVAAWSGAKITSLGGTPAYAQACTGVIVVDLSGGCRNTDQQSGCQFGYHTLKDTGLPAGFSVTNNVPEGTCCEQNHTPVLNFPAGITCTVHVNFNAPPQCTGASVGSFLYGPESDGNLAIPLTCIPPGCQTPPPPACIPFPSNTQYTIVANCATTGSPPECL